MLSDKLSFLIEEALRLERVWIFKDCGIMVNAIDVQEKQGVLGNPVSIR